MSDKSVFTDDEWDAISEAPLLISMAMSVVGPHGPISMIKESAASAKATAKTSPTTTLNAPPPVAPVAEAPAAPPEAPPTSTPQLKEAAPAAAAGAPQSTATTADAGAVPLPIRKPKRP